MTAGRLLRREQLNSYVESGELAELIWRCNREPEKFQIERDLLEEHLETIERRASPMRRCLKKFRRLPAHHDVRHNS